MVAMKLIPQILSWPVIVLVLLKGFPGRRRIVVSTGTAGFIVGSAGLFFLFNLFPGNLLFGAVKSALGVGFLLLWGISVAAIYRSTGRGVTIFRGERLVNTPISVAIFAALAGMVAGAVCTCRLQGINGTALNVIVLILSGVALAYGAWFMERLLPDSFRVSPSGMLAANVALLLFSASSILRLDLFSPLSMKVMKGVHDFVHQFMESILIPDHLFVRSVVWKYIGILFGKEVGFWGGMVIWFTPAVLIALAIGLERLPSVAHIRQGAQRRKLLASAIGVQRSLLITPLFSVAIFAAAAYQSSCPSVEYWDPKPVPVTATQAGEIFIPKKGEIALEDGKLHKYLFKQGGREARFFVLLTPAGKLTVDLDACAICKPDGYGQAEGSVICYYCKTLIPLETVGKPGGCNPVPVPFTEKADGVVIDGITLINSWSTTVQATARVKEGGK
jgi:MFS family permease